MAPAAKRHPHRPLPIVLLQASRCAGLSFELGEAKNGPPWAESQFEIGFRHLLANVSHASARQAQKFQTETLPRPGVLDKREHNTNICLTAYAGHGIFNYSGGMAPAA